MIALIVSVTSSPITVSSAHSTPLTLLSLLFLRATRCTLSLRPCLIFHSPGILWPQISASLSHPYQVWFTSLFFSLSETMPIFLKIAYLPFFSLFPPYQQQLYSNYLTYYTFYLFLWHGSLSARI